ncbi:hypothetical protein M3J09_002036 [Ascochyta lentis]
MPRLETSLIRAGRTEHPYLPLLLQTCRNLPTARDELRQLREYAASQHSVAQEKVSGAKQRNCCKDQRRPHRRLFADLSAPEPPYLLELCRQRALGRPLAYIRGYQPFGNLEILCEKQVLIPRQTTANYTLRIAELIISRLADVKAQLSDKEKILSVLDLCTGSGCIPLLLHALLAPHFPRLRIIGTDLSDHALRLAKRNLKWNLYKGNLGPRAGNEVAFIKHDILDEFPAALGEFDLVISNPPYATPQEYHSSAISKSVRCYEPVEALVPAEHPDPDSVSGHSYFTAINSIAQRTGAKAVICEMGLEVQFAYVCSELQASGHWCKVEVWRDQVYSGLLGGEPRRERVTMNQVCGLEVLVDALGDGLYRVVVGINDCWGWLNEKPNGSQKLK